MTPELKKVITQEVPDYFTWSLEQQENFRAELVRGDGALYYRIYRALLAELLEIHVTVEELEADEVELSPEEELRIKTVIMPILGIGEDYFFLDEVLSEGKTILNYPSLYEYDYRNFLLHMEEEKRRNAEFEVPLYRGALDDTWAQFRLEGEICYASFYMASSWLVMELDVRGNDYVDELIPHSLVPGPHHGEQLDDGNIHWNMVFDAGGREEELKLLHQARLDYMHATRTRLEKEYDRLQPGRVYLIREEERAHRTFIFTDRYLLPQIHFRTFVADCRRHEERDHSILREKLRLEEAALREFLNGEYQKLMGSSM